MRQSKPTEVTRTGYYEGVCVVKISVRVDLVDDVLASDRQYLEGVSVR